MLHRTRAISWLRSSRFQPALLSRCYCYRSCQATLRIYHCHPCRSFASSRLPDAFDEIEDRRAKQGAPPDSDSQEEDIEITAESFAALSSEEQEEIRRIQREMIAAEDQLEINRLAAIQRRKLHQQQGDNNSNDIEEEEDIDDDINDDDADTSTINISDPNLKELLEAYKNHQEAASAPIENNLSGQKQPPRERRFRTSLDYMQQFITPTATPLEAADDRLTKAFAKLGNIKDIPWVETPQEYRERKEQLHQAEGKWEEGTSRYILPDWLYLQTGNPEFIQPLPGSDPSRPTTVRYPFIPILRTTREINEASILHRLLQFERLVQTKHFLALERKRRQLEYERQYRDLSLYAQQLKQRIPKERIDLINHKPEVKNLPVHLGQSYVSLIHPHNIPVDNKWMADILDELAKELNMNGNMSTREKEKILLTAVNQMRWVYRRMMKDKEKGYTRITLTPPEDKDLRPDRHGHPIWQPGALPPSQQYTRTTVLRTGRIRQDNNNHNNKTKKQNTTAAQ